MSSNKEPSVSFNKSGIDVWSCKVGGKTYYLHVDDTSCPICFKNFANSHNLKRHLKIAHAPDTVKKECDKCDATFASVGALRHHVRLSRERTFRSAKENNSKMSDKKHCPECDKQITSKNLWSHMKEVHKLTNSNTAKAEVLVYVFKCEMYSFISKRKHDLKRHVMRKHSEVDVSIQCALCDKTFQYEQSHIL